MEGKTVSKIRDKWQAILAKTDLDERLAAGVRKYMTDKVRAKAVWIGAAMGLLVGFVVGKLG